MSVPQKKTFFICFFSCLVFGVGFFGRSVTAQTTGVTAAADNSDEILVTARGWQQPLSKTPGSVGVISREEIIQRQGASVPNVLEMIPGVAKVSDSAWGGDVNIRGLSRESVVVLIDGCKVNTATDINAQLGMIDPMDIERIEVLKGPISSLYGSGSIGGVVNIITRKGRLTKKAELVPGFAASVDSNPSGPNMYGFFNYNSPDRYVYFSQSYRHHDSYTDGAGDKMRNSQFTDYQTALRLGQSINDWNLTEAQAQYYEGRDIGIPGAGTAPLPVYADVTYPRIRRGLLSLKHTFSPEGPVFEKSELNVYYQFIDRRVLIDNYPASAPLAEVKPQADHDTYGTRWQNILALGDHKLTPGIDLWLRHFNGTRSKQSKSGVITYDKPLPNAYYASGGAFIEDDWQVIERLTINLGVRGDGIDVSNKATPQWEEQSSGEFNWNAHIGATYELARRLSLKIIGASGYRAASLEERYSYIELGGGKTKWGDPDLKPEQSAFGECSLNWEGERTMLKLSAFYNRLHDLITDKVVSSNKIVNANVREAGIYGAELEAQWHITDAVRLYGNVAQTIGDNLTDGGSLPNIAPLSGLAGIHYDSPFRIWCRAETRVTAAQTRTPEGIDPSGAWQTVGIRIGYDIASKITKQTFYAGVDNLLDENYSDYLTTSRGYTFNEPGRSFNAGYQVNF